MRRILKTRAIKTQTGCWEYRHSSGRGYGRTKFQNRVWGAHRLSYFLFKGEIGDKLVLHRCDNPPCIRPAHLYLGGKSENARDLWARDAAFVKKRFAIVRDPTYRASMSKTMRKKWQRKPMHNNRRGPDGRWVSRE